MKKSREIGFMPIPKVCFTQDIRAPSLALNAIRSRQCFYGASLNLMKSGNPCAAAICRWVGVSRDPAYRKRVLDMVKFVRWDQMGIFAEATATRNAHKRQINRDRD
jgi:hypothetical protein